ncbi:XdhC family protein [Terrisporobacter mayombei]|uniref:XdhC family protein n=1 Tax=Terrisporobacter mayombei TaxID=1541 RepID=UPI001D162AC3|nr:XdhC family protein [Terrisporobacter mayombei]MCC3870325.1 XdhC family protein [Terrisporobacter mayombei]
MKIKKNFVLASIVSSTGSTSRSKGTQMIIREYGSVFSTVGGGKMEASCIEKSVSSIKNKESFIYEFNLDNKDANRSEMVCG